MPRQIDQSFHIDLQKLLAPGRAVFMPKFDFTLTLFRPLPVPRRGTKRSGAVQYGPAIIHTEQGPAPGEWYGDGFITGEIRIYDKIYRYVIKHISDSDSILGKSLVYRVHRTFLPYLKCRALPDPKMSGYWRSVKPAMWEYFQGLPQFHLDVYSALMLQAVVYADRSTPLRTPVGLGRNAKSAIVMLKNRAKEAFRSEIETPDENMPFVDVVDLKNGKLVSITRMGAEKTLYPKNGRDMGVTYAVKLHDSYAEFHADLSDREAEVASAVDHWDDVFTLLSPEEELQILEMSDIPRSCIFLALRDTEVKLPDSIVRAAKSELNRLGASRLFSSAVADDEEDDEEAPFESSNNDDIPVRTDLPDAPQEDGADEDEDFARRYRERFRR